MYYTDEYLLDEFLARVRAELALRGHPVDRREFNEFMRAMSPLVMPEDDNPAWWADAYLEATGERAPAPRLIVV
jgi:hypothetical protein